jgi:2-(1,2-epoxy-1,2-dihydrophenyl)acetyl-CoA isomerase
MDTVVVERTDGIVTVTVSNPGKKNAATPQTWADLRDAFVEIGDRAEDRVVVLTGAGGDFCSGADLSTGPGRQGSHPLRSMRTVNAACAALFNLPQPTIAKVRGVAVGAGCNMALACDLVVASDSARFSEIFSRRGLSIDFGGSWLLPRRVGLHRAKELALFGGIHGAREVEAMGLVNRVLPDGELDAFVDGWAQTLAAGAPIALALTKRLLNNSGSLSLEQALDEEAAAQSVNLVTRDVAEATTAFLEKREPRFEGR